MAEPDLSALEGKLSEWRVILVVAAAHETGLISALAAEPMDAATLASRTGSDARAVWTVAEALADAGFLAREGDKYTFTPAGRAVLADETSPAYAVHSVMHVRDLIRRWLALPETIRTGRPVTREGSRRSPVDFVGAMQHGARATAPAVVDACLARKPDARSVLDAGGGPGIHASEFARRGLAVTVLDLPEVVDLALHTWAASTPVKLVSGDFNVSLPPGPFDIVFLGSVSHTYGPEQNAALLKRVAGVLSPGGMVAISDMVRGRSPRAAMFAVNMLTATPSGGTYTGEQYSTWLAQAGLRDAETEDLNGRDRQLITAFRR